MKINPAALFTTARKALATAVAVATTVEATGAVTGHLNSLLVQGIGIGGSILAATVTYQIGNVAAKPSAASVAEADAATAALFEKFVTDSGGGQTSAV